MKRHPRKKSRKAAAALTAPITDRVAAQREASQKAQQEWGGLQMSIPASELQDQCWYYGDDGANCVAVWDARAGCFWTVEFEEMPTRKSGQPVTRRPSLKSERPGTTPKKGFMPIAILERAA